MTILELFKTKTAEEIADEYVKEYRRYASANKVPLAFFFDGFNELCDCPEDCENYCEYDDYYECDSCYLDSDEECPYHINKDEALKKDFIDWLNMEVPKMIDIKIGKETNYAEVYYYMRNYGSRHY